MPELDRKIIGERIQTQRKSLKYSQDQLAEQVGISAKFLSDIERGLRGMSSQTLYDISQALHLTTDNILTGEDNHTEMDVDRIIGMLKKCDPDKIKYIEGIVLNFIQAVND